MNAELPPGRATRRVESRQDRTPAVPARRSGRREPVRPVLRERLRRQVQTLSAEGRLSAWILGALPPLFAVYLIFARPDYLRVLYTDPAGIVFSVAGVLLLAVGAFWMSKVVKVEV